MDQFSCRDQGTFQEQLRRQPRLDERIRVSIERCQLKLQAWASHCGEDRERGGRRRPQEPALPGIMTSPSVLCWQEAIYKGPPCTGHSDKTASGDLGAVSRASRWEPAPGVRSVGRGRL